MNTVTNLLAGVMILACAGSAVMDLRAPDELRATMDRLKVPASRLPVLAAIKGLAAVGLIAGYLATWLTVAVAGGLSLYFAVATLTHLRVKDGVRNTLPAFVLLTVSMLLVLASVAR